MAKVGGKVENEKIEQDIKECNTKTDKDTSEDSILKFIAPFSMSIIGNYFSILYCLVALFITLHGLVTLQLINNMKRT